MALLFDGKIRFWRLSKFREKGKPIALNFLGKNKILEDYPILEKQITL